MLSIYLPTFNSDRPRTSYRSRTIANRLTKAGVYVEKGGVTLVNIVDDSVQLTVGNYEVHIKKKNTCQCNSFLYDGQECCHILAAKEYIVKNIGLVRYVSTRVLKCNTYSKKERFKII